MKLLCLLLTALSLAMVAPLQAKTAAEIKEAREAADAKKKDGDKKPLLYTATIAPTLGEATEGDLTEVKTILLLANTFKCTEVKLEGKSIQATLSSEPKKPLSKTDVAKAFKTEPKYKVVKLDDVKPEKEKKTPKDDKKPDPKKPDDKKPDAKTPDPKKPEMKKDEPKPTDPKTSDPKAPAAK